MRFPQLDSTLHQCRRNFLQAKREAAELSKVMGRKMVPCSSLARSSCRDFVYRLPTAGLAQDKPSAGSFGSRQGAAPGESRCCLAIRFQWIPDGLPLPAQVSRVAAH
jgi:hypothetical protein